VATQAELFDILTAANEVNRLKAQYDAAVGRFNALVDGRRSAHVAQQAPTVPSAPVRRATPRGKAPNPHSLNQRVLAEIIRSPSPVAISALAVVLNATPRQIRYAVIYHQKRGDVVHAGLPEQYTMKGRLDNGASAEH
jgi:hypothetical protein